QGSVTMTCSHCDLIHAGAPIIVGGVHVATWLIGQVIVGTFDPSRLLLSAMSLGEGIDDKVRAEIGNIPRMTRERFANCLALLQRMTDEMSSLGYSNLELARGIVAQRQGQKDREAHLAFLKHMDRVNQSMLATNDYEKMLPSVLRDLLDIFECDRVWLMYPCDPDADSVQLPFEQARPEFANSLPPDATLDLDKGLSVVMREALVVAGPTCQSVTAMSMPEGAAVSGAKSQMVVALQTHQGDPWLLGLHQCSHERSWTEPEQRLFTELGRRIADALGAMLSHRSLLENSEHLQLALDVSNALVFEKNLQTSTYSFDEQSSRRLGYEPGEIGFDQEAMELILHPDDRDGAIQAVSDHVNQKTPYAQYEHRIRAKDGHWVDLLIRARVVEWDADGNPLRLMGTGMDITERKITENKLRTSEELLRSTFESTADGILVVNRAGQRTDYNSRFLDLWSIPEDVASDNPDLDLTDYILPQLVDPEGFRQKTNSLYDSESDDFDTIEFKTGRVLERYSSPLIKDGEVVGRVWSFRDVTQQKMAESELRESEERLETILATMQTGIVLTDPESDEIVDVNPVAARLLGDSRTAIVGRIWSDFVDQQTILSHSAAGYTDRTGERTLVACDQRRIPVLLSDTRIALLGRELILYSLVDITERIEAETRQQELKDKLERAERMESLGVLAGGVAHDLNNMLGPLVGYPDLILRKLDKDSPVVKQVQRMGRAAQDAADVIQDLLTLARRGRYEMVPTDLNAVVEGFLDSPGFAAATERNPGISVGTNLDATIGKLMGSSPHLAKVVMNLVVNALDATPPTGRVDVITGQEHLDRLLGGYDRIVPGDYLLLRVRDTGEGIAADDLDKVFEPYYSKKKMGSSGSGLGLSVVYGIVKDHKGYYDIFSEPGKGTEFVLYFPMVAADLDIAESKEEDFAGQGRILVVDDTPEQRQIAIDILSTAGYSVVTAEGGRQAVEYLKSNHVDLVLLDMIMDDDLDGLDTYREMLTVCPNQKALAVSGYSSTERVREMQSLGAGKYIRKPYGVATLCHAVKEELLRQPTGVSSD
ncbi:MAG: PAS domain S-box protein, partial [candidate division Zixibacteria bacterium]|nr:PAS domain S-box protein [candidate division Zixibacteria bacterium]